MTEIGEQLAANFLLDKHHDSHIGKYCAVETRAYLFETRSTRIRNIRRTGNVCPFRLNNVMIVGGSNKAGAVLPTTRRYAEQI